MIRIRKCKLLLLMNPLVNLIFCANNLSVSETKQGLNSSCAFFRIFKLFLRIFEVKFF